MACLLEALWQFLQSPVGEDNIRAVVTALAFVTSFLTYVLTTVITRKVYIRLYNKALTVVSILVGSLILSIAELIASISVFGISNFLLKSAFVMWTAGLIMLILLLRNMLSADRATFKKPKVLRTFEPFQDIRNGNERVCRFGLRCVDDQFQVATYNKPKQPLYFPILLVAEKYFRPWRFAARFAVAGLAEAERKGGVIKEGLIYFAFNQPAEIVVDQLARRFVNVMDPQQDPEKYWNPPNGKQVTKKFEWVKVIDCHSKWLEKKARLSPHAAKCKFSEAYKQVQVLFSDPRDPYDLSRQYKRAVEELLGRGIQRVRVVYDSISDFLIYSDPQLAVQFIKHNMVWEDEMKVSSLYVYIPGIPQPRGENPVDEGFLRWNSYCVVEFKHQEQGPDTMILEGLFAERIHEEVKSTQNSDYQVTKPQTTNGLMVV